MTRSDRDEAQLSEQVATIARRLLERPDELADQMTAAIKAAVPLYRNGVVDHDTLRTTSLVHLQAILGSLGRNPATTSPESRENGRQRAAAGVPLAAILEAYRVAARFMWEQVAETSRSVGAGSEVVLRAGSEMWQVLDTYSQELADGYREEAAAQALSAEQQRSALFQALFEGHLATTNPWEAAELLRLPPNGPLVVVAAEVPAIGRHALSRGEQALRDVGLTSVWRLLPDIEIGVVSLPGGPPNSTGSPTFSRPLPPGAWGSALPTATCAPLPKPSPWPESLSPARSPTVASRSSTGICSLPPQSAPPR